MLVGAGSRVGMGVGVGVDVGQVVRHVRYISALSRGALHLYSDVLQTTLRPLCCSCHIDDKCPFPESNESTFNETDAQAHVGGFFFGTLIRAQSN
jgi:hypothetical protein